MASHADRSGVQEYVRPGAHAHRVRDRLRALLAQDVLVLTRSEFIAREIAYGNATTPVGYVFAFGAVMGFVVGAIVVYQIQIGAGRGDRCGRRLTRDRAFGQTTKATWS